MVVWSGLGPGLKLLILGGAAAAAVAVGAVVWQGEPAPEPPAATATPAPAAADPAPAAVPSAVAAASAPAEPPTPAVAAAEPPSFDVVRVEPDGAALVAGRAEAGEDVAVLIDGAEAALAQSDPQGRFVVFLTLASSAEARVMTLELRPRGGAVVPSSDQVLLAPTPSAGAAPDPAAEIVAGTPPPAAPAPAEPEPVAAAPEADAAPAGADAAPALAQVVDTTAEAPEVVAPDAPTAPAQAAASLAETGVVAAPAQQQISVATAVPAAPSDPASAALQPVQPVAPVAAAPAAPVAILLSGDTARVLQSPDSAAPPGAISIDAISYTAGGAVALSGRGEARAFVRLYLDNRAVLETGIAADGAWAGTLPGVAPGVYTLRADQVSAQGQVTSRFETPFQREDPEALAVAVPAPAPSGATPAATATAAAAPGKVSITVQPGFTLWQIARDTYGDGMLYVRVYDANKTLIGDPDLIYPGQVFAVPQGD